jgi:hypothetical protein
VSDLRAAALNADDIDIETVIVPEWGGNTYGVKAMTLEEQRRFIRSVMGADGTVDRDRYAVQLLLASIVDPDTGEPVFEAADAEALAKKSGKATNRLLTVANKQAGLGDTDEAVESLDETLTSDSGSS